MKYFETRKCLPQTTKSKRGTIQYLYSKGLKISEISKELKVSRPMVYKWINKTEISPRRKKRKYKLKDHHFEFIINEDANKFGINSGASARAIRNKLLNRFGETFAISTINRHLNSYYQSQEDLQKHFS